MPTLKNKKQALFSCKQVFLYGMLLLFLVSCQGKHNKREEAIVKIPVSFQIERFGKQFAAAHPKDLPNLKARYPFLFPKQYPDSLWVAKMNDSTEQALHAAVLKEYPTTDTLKRQLHSFFQHLKYYFPQFKVPRIITLTSDVDFRHSVIVTDSLLLISLDTYLGAHHPFYYGIKRYFSEDFIRSQIVPDVAHQYAERYIHRPKKRSFLAYMVYYGKIRYFMKRMLPQVSEAAIMSYSEKELQWAQNNERQIWGYFIEHRLLYKTDPNLRTDFFAIGPYTKFGLVLDSESPPQLGQYMGLQIVKQYVKQHEKEKLQTLLQLDNETLFKASNYKPKQQK